MTDLLLRNKKLLNEVFIDFNYNNEIFNNEVNDLITSFKYNYNTTTISLDDKIILYNFIKDNKNKLDIYKNVINDFITLLQYLNDLKQEEKENKDNNISENSKIKIYEVYEKLKGNLSKEFLSVFKDKNDLTANKTSEIFEYYLKLIYKDVKNEIKNYQKKISDNNEKELEYKKNKLKEYFEKKSSLISKTDLATAIRLFMTLILFREEDKENKIQYNRKNIVNYLKAQDLWDKNIYNDEKFNENLNEIKKINIKINTILWLHNYLIDNEEENFSKEVEEYIERNNPPNRESDNNDDNMSDSDDDDDEGRD